MAYDSVSAQTKVPHLPYSGPVTGGSSASAYLDTLPSSSSADPSLVKAKNKDPANLGQPKPVDDSGFHWAKRFTSSKFPKTLAEVTISAEGRPRVKVPNAVFERGARIHSDFIVGIFYGNAPSYGKVWGVLNFLWGKDRRVTIHNLTENAFLFHIPSVSVRRKVLQHELWRVGDSPFFVTEWKASFSLNPPSLQQAPIWASINQVPFDLITEEGLSFISRPLGQIVDAKPFNSVSSVDVKVIVDLTKPLPNSIEIERDDGAVVLLSVTYPWFPPLCPVCNEIGHKANLCPSKGPKWVKKD